MLLTLLAAVVGERHAGRTLPRPKALAAILLFYGLLGVAAELGRQAERVAGAVAVVLMIATVFLGAAGQQIIDLLSTVTGWLGGGGSTSSAPTGGGVQAAAAAATHVFSGGFSVAPAAPAAAGLRPARP